MKLHFNQIHQHRNGKTGANNWRGDVFEPELRAAIIDWETSIDGDDSGKIRDGGQP